MAGDGGLTITTQPGGLMVRALVSGHSSIGRAPRDHPRMMDAGSIPAVPTTAAEGGEEENSMAWFTKVNDKIESHKTKFAAAATLNFAKNGHACPPSALALYKRDPRKHWPNRSDMPTARQGVQQNISQGNI